MDYHSCNGRKRFYIGDSMVKGSRRVHRMRVGHYADDIALMWLNLWKDTGV